MAVKKFGYHKIPIALTSPDQSSTLWLKYAGRATAELNILEGLMSFNKGLKQLQRTVTLDDGTTLNCQIVNGIKSVQIVPLKQKPPEGIGKKKCFCDCNFAIALVIDITPVEDQVYSLYTVVACFKEYWYKIYDNVLSSDFTPWEIGSKCLVMAYHDFLFDCCNDNFNASGCNPIKDEDNEVLSEDWRSTVRIVPLCAIPISDWDKF